MRKTEAMPPRAPSKLSKMGKNALVSVGLMCATCMTRTGHVLAQGGSALTYLDDVPEELGAPLASEEFWHEGSTLQHQQPVVSEKSDMDTGGSTADFDVETEEAEMVIDESSADGATAKAMNALVDKTTTLQQAARRSFSRISLKSHVVGPIGGCAVVLSSGIGAYMMTKRRRRIPKAMPTATASTPKPHEGGGGADLDLELLDADPVPRQYSPAAPDISSLEFFPGEPPVVNEAPPENEPNASGRGSGGSMSKKTSHTTGKPPVPASFSPPRTSESKNNNLGFGSLFKRVSVIHFMFSRLLLYAAVAPQHHICLSVVDNWNSLPRGCCCNSSG